LGPIPNPQSPIPILFLRNKKRLIKNKNNVKFIISFKIIIKLEEYYLLLSIIHL
jgi:hypothetical protein